MPNYLRRLLDRAFRRGASPGSRARQRLQIVLVQDRIGLSPEMLDSLKGDLMEVISRYVVIDWSAAEIEVKRTSGEVVLVSNIPITGARTEAAS